ncbi:hypothetical protein C8241_04505 [Paracidovorax avenae]|uniref:hypothetical protein n=1 Tax=Paracidovorax avenae TaxID=80867 RepID=UPI000D163CB5|nr:hypothetical protein [Paracidovorax avenae]AVS61071.1 hypothetical protein C8241_04505 [Paracidovorax avenae]
MTANNTVGAWTPFNFDLTADAKQVLEEATPLGVKYTPLAFATQVVAGTNYSYLSKAETVVVPEAALRVVVIRVHKPLSGKPYVTSIVEVNP